MITIDLNSRLLGKAAFGGTPPCGSDPTEKPPTAKAVPNVYETPATLAAILKDLPTAWNSCFKLTDSKLNGTVLDDLKACQAFEGDQEKATVACEKVLNVVFRKEDRTYYIQLQPGSDLIRCQRKTITDEPHFVHVPLRCLARLLLLRTQLHPELAFPKHSKLTPPGKSVDSVNYHVIATRLWETITKPDEVRRLYPKHE